MRIIPLIVLLFASMATNAQNCNGRRYLDRMFPNITKYSNLVFASDVPNIGTVYISEMITTDINLTMDIYEPTGDTLRQRPCVVLSYGGGWIFGTKDDDDINSACDSLAHLGYVTVVINYRMGLNLTSTDGLERAIYRGTQDFSSAVRFLKEYSGQYGIDTNLIFVGGVSAGGFGALHMAFMDEADRPQSTYAAGGLSPRPDLGCKDCSGNNFAHSSNVAGVINYWGALQDTNMLNANNARPTLFFHGENDLIVPYDEGAPFSASLVAPSVNGSALISRRMDNLGMYNELNLFPGVGHNIWGLCVLNRWSIGPTQYYDTIYHSTRDFLYKIIRPQPPTINSRNTICKKTTTSISVANHTAGATYCWEIPVGNIASVNTSGPGIQASWDSAGTYAVIVKQISKNHAISEPDTFWMTVTDLPQYTLTATSPVCYGDSTLLQISAGGVGYEWLGPGVYDETARVSRALPPGPTKYGAFIADSNGCIVLDSVFVDVYTQMASPTFTFSNDTLFTSLTSNIKWYQDGQLMPTSLNWITPLGDATFWVTTTDSNGCALRSADYNFSATGIATTTNTQFEIYPNPVNNWLHIRSNTNAELQFKLYNITGKLVLTERFTNSTNIQVATLATGIYTYEITDGNSTQRGKLLR